MPNIIYKYNAPEIFGMEEKITLPQFAEFLSLQQQGETLVMWFKVDLTMPNEDRYFVLQPTGQEFDESNLNYLGTIQWEAAHLKFHGIPVNMVGHLFERL